MLAHAHIVKELIHRLGVFVGIISAEENVVQAKDIHGTAQGAVTKIAAGGDPDVVLEVIFGQFLVDRRGDAVVPADFFIHPGHGIGEDFAQMSDDDLQVGQPVEYALTDHAN